MREFDSGQARWVLRPVLIIGLICSGGPGGTEAVRLMLVGSSATVGSHVRLTPAARNKVGAAWWPEKKYVREGFDATFRFQISDRGGIERGADGFAFVLQNSGSAAIGGRGSAGGFMLGDGYGNPDRPGIPRSLAVFFDTFRNVDAKDPSGNYIGIFTNGPLHQMHWPPPRLGFTKKLPFRLKDGRTHSARILYKTPLMSVWLDEGSEPVLSVPVDLATVIDEMGRAYAGFTASTGDGYENHDVFDWSLVSSSVALVQSSIQFLNIDCMEGRNLCTPKLAIVEKRGPDRYRVVLPPYFEWAASIPNPTGHPVEISDGQGHVCWDVSAPGQTGCSGPDDALIQKTEKGRTWFSVNAPKGADVTHSQGFFEFHATVQ